MVPQGPQGLQGIQGVKGDKGDKGDTGSPGVDTLNGFTIDAYSGTTDANGTATVSFGKTYTSIKGKPWAQAVKDTTAPSAVASAEIRSFTTAGCIVQTVQGISGSLLGLTNTFSFAPSVDFVVFVHGK